eukprot:Gb_00679 [translate_table: standard]
MYRFSNSVIGILNFLTFLFSIPILGGGLWLTRNSTVCERFLQWPVILIGGFIMVVSLAGFVGACFRVSWLLWIYLFVMFFLILLLLSFTVFAFLVTGKGSGRAVPGREYKEYHLGDYSLWLQNHVQNAENWRKIRSCISDAKVCSSLAQQNLMATDFFQRRLSPIQSGCCKPPTSCGFTYVNPIYWNGPAQDIGDPDCSLWSNAQDQLCYDCSSCKASILANLKRDWHKVSVVNIVMLIFLIVVYSIGCCAFRNNRRTDTDYAHGKTRMTKANPRSLW